MITQIELEWSPPYSFQDLLPKNEGLNLKEAYNASGVYIWMSPTEPGANEMELAYVGKATGKPSLWARQIQHYKLQISGLYSIPSNYFDGSKWDATEKMVAEHFFDFGKYSRIAQLGFEYAQDVKIFLAYAPQEYLKDIELNLLYSLQPKHTTWGTIHPPKNILPIRHKNFAAWARPEILKEVKTRITLQPDSLIIEF